MLKMPLKLAALAVLLLLSGCATFGGPNAMQDSAANPWSGQPPYEWPPYQQSYAEDLNLGPAPRALLAEADAHYEAGQLESSAAAIERALRLEPRSPVLWYRLSSLRASLGDHSGANRLAEKANSLLDRSSPSRVEQWLGWLNQWLLERLRPSAA